MVKGRFALLNNFLFWAGSISMAWRWTRRNGLSKLNYLFSFSRSKRWARERSLTRLVRGQPPNLLANIVFPFLMKYLTLDMTNDGRMYLSDFGI